MLRWLILIVVVIGIAAVLMRRRRARPAAAARAVAVRHAEPYHCVEIEPGPRGSVCPAVHDQAGRRYLAGEAPQLPLNDCTQAGACTCHYVHHHDRRTEPRRRSDVGLPDAIPAGSSTRERRGPSDRRSD